MKAKLQNKYGSKNNYPLRTAKFDGFFTVCSRRPTQDQTESDGCSRTINQNSTFPTNAHFPLIYAAAVPCEPKYAADDICSKLYGRCGLAQYVT